MKKKLIPIIGLALVLASGCVVRSVYPFYTAMDVVFDAALLGSWTENDSDGEHWKFERLGEKGYWLTAVGKTETNSYEATLFRLKDQSFLNLCPTNRSEDFVPLHFLMKIEQITPALKFSMMKPDWLEKLVEKDPKAIRHIVVPTEPGSTGKGQLVLTADTKELQAFVLKYSSNTNAFTETIEFKRRKE